MTKIQNSRHFKILWSPTGKPVAPISFADSLRERRDLVARHPDRNRIHPRLKPWLSAVGVNIVCPLAVSRARVLGIFWLFDIRISIFGFRI